MMRVRIQLILGLLVLLTAPIYGQVSTATVSGAVADSSGAILPHVTVTAREQATGTVTKAETNDAGQYTLPFLKAGVYTLEVAQSGFDTYRQRGLALSGGDHPIIDIAMKVGSTGTTVDVEADLASLGTSDASIGQVVTTKQIEDLPLNGRTPLSFAQYSPGVIATTNPSGQHAYDNSGLAAFSVAGLPNKNAEILLDGSPDNASDNAPAYSPPIDATAEVRLNVFESDAAYGHSGGGVANQVTKSGTNRFHGVLYEFNQISALNASPYFNKRVAGFRKTVTRYNQFGATLGGPVWIPKVFNGRDKAFFFLAYEGIRNPFPGGAFVTVPTQAERNGDFSALLGQKPAVATTLCGSGPTAVKLTHDPAQLYDPYTTMQAPGCPTGILTRAPIPGNIITRPINAVTKSVLNYLPLPNSPGSSVDGSGNYYTISQGSDTYDNQFGRLDVNIGTRNKLYITGRHNERNQVIAQTFGPSNPAFGDVLQRVNWGGSIGDVMTLNSSTVAELKLNYTRFQQNTYQNGDGFNYASLGLPYTSQHAAFPMFVLSSSFLSPGTTTMPSLARAPFNSYAINADVLKSFSHHSLKVGVDLRLFQKGGEQFAATSSSAAGRFTFDNSWTRVSPNVIEGVVQGQDLAALYLGLPTSGTVDQYASSFGQQKYMSFFVQDDWRVSPNLTLNLGLRFDRDFSPIEMNGRAVNGFDTTSTNPVATAAIAAYAASPNPLLPASQFTVNGGLTFASSGNRQFSQFPSNMFSPRFGFSWKPSVLGKDTVVRGGFGIFVLPIFPFNNAIQQQGFSQQTVETTSNDNFVTPATTLSNPFPGGLVAPTGSSLGLATFNGNNITILSPVIRNGYAERFTLDVQRKLPLGVLGEVAYIANVAHRLPISQFPNYVRRQFETTASSPSLSANAVNPFRGLLPNSANLNGANVRVAQLLAVYPQLPVDSGLTVLNVPAGSSNFHALEVRAERRIQHGITFFGNYQFSKLMEAVSYLNNSDPRPEYRISQYDRPHHLVIGVTADLPYGKGRMFGSGAPYWLQLPLGGWTLNSLYLMQSGAPLSFGNIVPFNINNLQYNPRQATATSPSTTIPSFDTTQFDRAGGDQPVFNIRTLPSQFSTLRTDKLMNWDASIMKNFNIVEGTYFQFRFEAYNVANRPSFAGPNLSPTSGSFGQITSTQNSNRVIQMAGRLVF